MSHVSELLTTAAIKVSKRDPGARQALYRVIRAAIFIDDGLAVNTAVTFLPDMILPPAEPGTEQLVRLACQCASADLVADLLLYTMRNNDLGNARDRVTLIRRVAATQPYNSLQRQSLIAQKLQDAVNMAIEDVQDLSPKASIEPAKKRMAVVQSNGLIVPQRQPFIIASSDTCTSLPGPRPCRGSVAADAVRRSSRVRKRPDRFCPE